MRNEKCVHALCCNNSVMLICLGSCCLPFRSFPECLLAKCVMTLVFVGAQTFNVVHLFSEIRHNCGFGITICRRAPSQAAVSLSMKLNDTKVIFSDSNHQAWWSLLQPSGLKMPEPLTTVGLECQPIKVLTVKWTLLTFIAKHSTKFNDHAYEQNKRRVTDASIPSVISGSEFVSRCCHPVSIVIIVLNQSVKEEKSNNFYSLFFLSQKTVSEAKIQI